MGVLKKIFLERKKWWHLVPDQTVFTSGGNANGKVLNLAARHKDGQWIMAYLGSQASFSINMDKLAGQQVKAIWIGGLSNAGVKSFSTPADWEDALLVLEASSD